jgi:hypothetical protein
MKRYCKFEQRHWGCIPNGTFLYGAILWEHPTCAFFIPIADFAGTPAKSAPTIVAAQSAATMVV